MIRLLALVLGILGGLTPGISLAGSWPREAGTGFASLSQWQGLGTSDGYTALFLEYGLTRRLTLGIDTGRSVSGDGKAVMFLRVPVLRLLGGPVAAEIGYGEIGGQRVLRPGLSWGRSFTRPRWQGWVAVDSRVELGLDRSRLDEKTDITFGLTPRRPDGQTADWTVMLQVQTGVVDIREQLFLLQTEGIQPGASFVRLVPSVTYRLREGLDLEIGYFRALDGTGAQGIKLGLWSSF
jgi:hypothetical protein